MAYPLAGIFGLIDDIIIRKSAAQGEPQNPYIERAVVAAMEAKRAWIEQHFHVLPRPART